MAPLSPIRVAPRVAEALTSAASAKQDGMTVWGLLVSIRHASSASAPPCVLATLRAPAGLPCEAKSAVAFLGDAQTLLPVGVEVCGLYIATTGADVPNPSSWWPKPYSATCVIARPLASTTGDALDATYEFALWKRDSGEVSSGVGVAVDASLDEQLQEGHVQLQCSLTLAFPIVQLQGHIWTEHVNDYIEKLREQLKEAPLAFAVEVPQGEAERREGAKGAVGKKGGSKSERKPDSVGKCILQKGIASMTGTFGELCQGAPEDSVLVTSMLMLTSSASETPASPAIEYLPAPDTALSPVAPVSLSLNFICYIGRNVALEEGVEGYLLPGVLRQLNGCAKLLMQQSFIHQLKVYQFRLAEYPFKVATVYSVPKGGDDTAAAAEKVDADNVAKRRLLHEVLGLPGDRPLLRVANAWRAKSALDAAKESARLSNVHIGLPASGVKGTVTLLSGDYDYFHYMQDRFDDAGWGCAYRSLQTLMSWFIKQHYTSKPVLSHREIQQMLVDMGDKPAKFVGSREWIGAIELSYILDTHMGVTSKLITVSAGAEMPSKAREIARHFDTQGTPIMIGGGVLAYTLLGIDYNEDTGDCAFLILDPHYTGGEDISRIHAGTWVCWKRIGDKAAAGGDLFVKDAFYNLLCPQRPNAI